MMNVFAIVGPSGCGKTSVVDTLKSSGITTMDENYIGSYPTEFSNRELLSKWQWVAQWIERVWALRQLGIGLVVSDRYPLDVVPYSTHGILFLEPVKHTLKELEYHGVQIQTIYLRVPFQVCFERSQSRVRYDPSRRILGEGDLEYFSSIYDFYEKGIGNLWDFIIDASEITIEEVAIEIIELIE